MRNKLKAIQMIAGIVVLITIIGFAVTACGSTSSASPNLGVYDQSVSEDQLVTLEIAGGLKVVGFNGVRVSWAENGTERGEDTLSSNAWRAMKDGSEYKTIIKIPAGNHTLLANLYLWDYNKKPGAFGDGLMGQRAGYIKASGLEITHDFLPGQTYFLRPILVVKPSIGRDRGKEIEYEDYTGSGGKVGKTVIEIRYIFHSTRLRIDENGTPVATGNTVTR
ncbi:MAG: hypothetical protein FWD47_14810 [Treponema sp.]|nr:hypothetical protein [Treponema sp.]